MGKGKSKLALSFVFFALGAVFAVNLARGGTEIHLVTGTVLFFLIGIAFLRNSRN